MSTIESIENPEDSFSSQQELWKYLIEGGKVYHTSEPDNIFSFVDGKLLGSLETNPFKPTPIFRYYEEFRKHTPSSEFLLGASGKGVICQIKNIPSSSITITILLKRISINNKPFYESTEGLLYDAVYNQITPLLAEEIKAYFIKEI